MKALLVVGILLVGVLAGSVADAAPTPDAPVDDQAAILSETDKARLVEELRGLARDGVAMAVVVVRSTEGVSIQQFSRSAAEAWSSGPGAAAILVVATGDKKMRIEVNEKLRPKFPDARAQKILDNQRSAFRGGDYAGGIRSIILDVRSVALGAETPTGETATPPAQTAPEPYRSSGGGNAGVIILVVVGIAVLLGIGALVAAAKRSRSLSLTSNGATNLTPFWIDMLLGTLQVIGFLFVIIAIFASATSSSSSSSSSLFGGGGSSGGGSSSGGGGGGWSGGGASSSW